MNASLRLPAGCLVNVFSEFNKAAIEVCVGQQLDIDFEKMTVIATEDYLRMIELKTAVLLAASAKIGAVIGGASGSDAGLLYEFGRNIGLAFQIQDDLLDIIRRRKGIRENPRWGYNCRQEDLPSCEGDGNGSPGEAEKT